MIDLVTVDPSDVVPIWRQIEDRVRQLAASGTLTPGAGVASVRELARGLRVNPATVSKAYQRLVDAGVLVVRRGEGTFVAYRPTAAVSAERRRLLADQARRYAEAASALGAGRRDAIEVLRQAWKEIEDLQRDGR